MADLSIPQTFGGQKTVVMAAGSSTANDVTLVTGSGRINKIVFISANSTAGLALYDGASASGIRLWISPAAVALGAVYDLDLPFTTSLVGVDIATTGDVIISYTEDNVPNSGPDNVRPVTEGGQYAKDVAAATAGVISAVPGRLCKLVVLAQGSVVTPIYDNASAASGTKLFVVPASGTTAVAAGTVYSLQLPVTNGIYVGGTTNTSSVCISYNKTGAYGK